MEKLVYLLGSEIPPDELRCALTGALGERMLASGLHELEVFVSDQTGPHAQLADPKMDPEGLMSASVSLWLDSLDARQPIESTLREVSVRLAGYAVSESVPREYANRSWPDCQVSPTVTLGTALSPRPGVDDSSFFARWHGSHTPLSLRIHPLTRYVRNTVTRAITPDAPPYRGLIFESVASLEILADVGLFYGGEANRQEAVADLLSFADIKTMASVTMSETILRSAPWRRPDASRA